MRVHSPTSVGATRRPMSALTSVDLPAFSRPAIATRNGSPSRRRTSKTCAWAAPPSRWPTSWQRSATRELSGPEPIASVLHERVGVRVAVVHGVERPVEVRVGGRGDLAVLVRVLDDHVGAPVVVLVGHRGVDLAV